MSSGADPAAPTARRDSGGAEPPALPPRRRSRSSTVSGKAKKLPPPVPARKRSHDARRRRGSSSRAGSSEGVVRRPEALPPPPLSSSVTAAVKPQSSGVAPVVMTRALRQSLRRSTGSIVSVNSVGSFDSIDLNGGQSGQASLDSLRRRSASESGESFLSTWDTIHMLERYVPDIVMEHIIQAVHNRDDVKNSNTSKNGDQIIPELTAATGVAADDGDNSIPVNQRLYQQDAVVVLADISGFTKLAERLARDNSGGEGRGTETLSRKLNNYFGRMIDMIYEGGGDVVKFAGDALLVVWRKAESLGRPAPTTPSSSFSGGFVRSAHSRRPSVELTAAEAGLLSHSNPPQRRASRRASLQALASDGSRGRPFVHQESGQHVRRMSSRSSAAPRRLSSVQRMVEASVAIAVSETAKAEARTSELMTAEGIDESSSSDDDEDTKSNDRKDGSSSSSSSSEESGNDGPTMAVIKLTRNVPSERPNTARKHLSLKRPPELVTAAADGPTNLASVSAGSSYSNSAQGSGSGNRPISSRASRRSSMRRSKKVMKRRESWRTTMTNWRKKEG